VLRTCWRGLARVGVVWHVLAWFGTCWRGLARVGVVWHVLAWFGTCWRGLARVGVRRQFDARSDARCGIMPRKNLDAEAFRFGGEGRNRTRSSPTASLNILICEAILTQCLQGFQELFYTIRQLSGLTRHLPASYSVIEGFVEGFVEGSSDKL